MIDCLFISILFLPADFFLGPGAGQADSTESRVERECHSVVTQSFLNKK